MTPVPSIAKNLTKAFVLVTLLSSAVVALAVWLVVRNEVKELLNETLQSAAVAMRPQFSQGLLPLPLDSRPPNTISADDGYAWQLVVYSPSGAATRIAGSVQSPAEPFAAQYTEGSFSNQDWQIFGVAINQPGQMLYVAQRHSEQTEAALEIAISAAIAGIVVSMLTFTILRIFTQRELAPVERLAKRLQVHDILAAPHGLGLAERTELQAVHAAIDALALQLNQRLANERAFSAHAAHSLRTPLAGIDAQLAMALREVPAAFHPRLERIRSASTRLQGVVSVLLALFRSHVVLQREPLQLAKLIEEIPAHGLAIDIVQEVALHADPDLVSAVLINLLDNAVRYGADQVHISTHTAQTLRIQDNGPGLPPAKRAALAHALMTGQLQSEAGLGLSIAQLVAQAHGGYMELPDTGSGFTVDIHLGPATLPS